MESTLLKKNYYVDGYWDVRNLAEFHQVIFTRELNVMPLVADVHCGMEAARLIAKAPEMRRLLLACATVIKEQDAALSKLGKGITLNNIPGFAGGELVDYWIMGLLKEIRGENDEEREG